MKVSFYIIWMYVMWHEGENIIKSIVWTIAIVVSSKLQMNFKCKAIFNINIVIFKLFMLQFSGKHIKNLHSKSMSQSCQDWILGHHQMNNLRIRRIEIMQYNKFSFQKI